jgi:6-phosphogluconate dehydrogenase (decarboxylating)
MGSRMAANLLKAGHAVTVRNRSPAKTLVTAGAQLAASPKAAAQGADFVIAMVRDDDASRDLWLSPETGAFAGLSQGAVAIESSTLTANWARTLGEEAKQRGLTFLEAPVAGSRPQAEAAQLVYFVGGDAAAAARAEPILKAMGSAIHHVGPTPTSDFISCQQVRPGSIRSRYGSQSCKGSRSAEPPSQISNNLRGTSMPTSPHITKRLSPSSGPRKRSANADSKAGR